MTLRCRVQIPWGNWDQSTGIMMGPRNTPPYSTFSIVTVSPMVARDHWFPLIQLKRDFKFKLSAFKGTSAQPVGPPQYPALLNLPERGEHDSDVVLGAFLGDHADKQLPVFHC